MEPRMSKPMTIMSRTPIRILDRLAMNIEASGTRREELLMDQETVKKVWLLRRMAAMIASDSVNFAEATERVLERLAKTKTNAEFLANLNREI